MIESAIRILEGLVAIGRTDEGRAVMRKILGMDNPTPEQVATVLRKLPVLAEPRKET